MRTIFLIAAAGVVTESVFGGLDPNPLGTAAPFAVLGGSTVTSTGNTVVNGNLGVYPGLAITGFPPGIVVGITYSGGAIAQQAQADARSAFTTLGLETPTQNLTGTDLGGLTLSPGIRNFNSSAQLTGTLILDAGGNSNARFDFLIGSTLTTATDSKVTLINGARADNVYWRIGTSATLGTGTSFFGDILADQSITFVTRSTLYGRALALTGAVTMDNNIITVPSGVPEVGDAWSFAAVCLGVVGYRWTVSRRRAQMVA